MKVAALSLLLAISAAAGLAQPAPQAEERFISEVVLPATVLLYYQGDGQMMAVCTAVAIDHKGETYTFATAGHCIRKERKHYFVTDDGAGEEKQFIRLRNATCGAVDRGDDFCLLEIKTKREFPLINLGHDATGYSVPVVNVASPGGMGKRVYRGYIASPKLDRPMEVEDASWPDAMSVQIPAYSGSSGSAVICLEQRAICGFIVGKTPAEAVALPVSRFIRFREQVARGDYEWPQKAKK